MTMNFSLCTDNNYAVPCLVCITSILENNKGHECHIYVLTSGLSKENHDKFSMLADAYGQNIKIIDVPSDSFSDLKTRHRYGTSMYYRFLLPELVEEDRILYLDCDIIVREDLSELFDCNIDDYACGVVEDQRGDEVELHNRIRSEAPYFNSGVLLINLDYWRRNTIKDKLCKYISDYPERCFFPDQDALNAVLSGKVKFLPYTYNFQEQWYWEDSEKAILFTKWDDINRYKDNPAIVHYTWNLKPWMEQCWHCHKDWFLSYARLHDFIGFEIQMRYKPSFMSRCFVYIMKRCMSGIRKTDTRMRKMKAGDIFSFFHIDEL